MLLDVTLTFGVQAVTTGLSDSLVCTVFIGIKTNRVCDIQSFFLPPLQLAQGQDGSFRRFAVLEFATAEMAEEAQRLADGRLLAGTHIRVSFCAPGPPGRSMLAALIAAQTMVLEPN